VQHCITSLDGSIYETYPLDLTRQLEHSVEANEYDRMAGSKGLVRAVERHESYTPAPAAAPTAPAARPQASVLSVPGSAGRLLPRCGAG
jgi:hypothetical protein